MGMTYQEAKRCGLEHLWPTESKPLPMPAAPLPSVGKPPNKLEAAFWERLEDAKRHRVFKEIYEHPIKLKVIGRRYYIPDFMTTGPADWMSPNGSVTTIWETKGHMREDAELKLIAAAERYPMWDWILVKQPNRNRWECRRVTAAGISREVWTPDWLR